MPCPDPIGDRPTFIPAVDTARAVLSYTLFGQTVQNVFYFKRSGGYNAGTVEDLADQIETEWNAELKANQPPQLTLNSVTVTDQETAGGVQHVATVGSAGTNASAAFPDPGATLAIKFATGLSGRSHRGRMYVPSLIDGLVASGIVDAGFANALVTDYADFFGAILSATGDQHVIVSYANDCEWRTTAEVNAVTSYSYTDRNVDSQRRRLPGRGI